MTKARHYGFLGGIGGKVRLSLEEVGRVIKVVGKELERRCKSYCLGVGVNAAYSKAWRHRFCSRIKLWN